MKKRIVTVALVLALLATCFAGTYAYLTDTDQAVNTMTLGNVDIEQLEYQRVFENGEPVLGVEGTDFNANYGIDKSYKLEEFVQDKPAYPAYYSNSEDPIWDDFQQLWNQIGAPGSNDIFDDSMKNVIDKFVFVENTGKSEVYFRTIILIECPEGVTDEIVHVNINNNARYDFNGAAEGDGRGSSGEPTDMGIWTINGDRFIVFNATHTEALPAGEIARPSLLQVYLDPDATNENCAAFGEKWEILALSQAVQTAGFPDASTALDEAFGEISVENLQDWFFN